jgi:dimethylhistidine N-methyltransferase
MTTSVRPEPSVDSRREFAADVARDLQRTPKQLQSKYLYDALGSSLFEAICRLPWYRITRAESRLLEEHASAIIASVADQATIVELGCGSGEKLALIADAMRRRRRPSRVHLIDVSSAALDQSARTLGRYEQLSIVGHRATYEQGLQEVARQRTARESLLVLLLGSNIGNFDPPAGHEFLESIHAALAPGDRLLLGADLVKPERDLRLAYDDPIGVTAAFNKNLLVRINQELAGTFDLTAFAHRAVWNPDASRVEMHLVSTRRQTVAVDAAEIIVEFAPGEHIWTESSYKYEADQVIDMGAATGFATDDQWIDPAARFALTLFARS